MTDHVPLPLPRTRLVGDIERRLMLRGTLGVGALTLLSGCDVSDTTAVQGVLAAMSRWNDRVQETLFGATRLAPVFAEADAVADFRYNAYFPKEKAPRLDAADYRLALSGLVADKRPWTVDQLHALPQVSQITRHICVEGWSLIGKWTGTPFRTFLERIGADTTARYVGFTCADGYYESLDMPTALHPQTMMAFRISDRVLPTELGFPFKLRIPTKLGFKNPKWITSIYVTNREPGGFWTDRGYNWFSGS